MGKKIYIIVLISLLITSNLFSASVKFQRGKATLTPDSYATLNKIGAELLKAYQADPNLTIEIFGYTDNRGSVTYNKRLSLKRAITVRNYFVKKFNIPKERFIVKGMGPANPIASNATAEGREKNRRVEIRYKGKKIVLSSAKEEPIAWIEWFKNKVKYKPKDKPIWKSAQKNQSLYKLWKVNTLKNSFSGIQFHDGSALTMSPETLIIIYGKIGESMQKLEKNKYDIELTRGALLNKLKSIDSKKPLKIKTPASSLSIFSKENNIEVNKNEDTLTSVYQGYVYTKALGKTVKVPEGYGNIVEKGKAPQKPVKLPNTPMNFQVKNNGHIKKGEPLHVKWDDVPNASFYEFQLSTDKEFRDIIESKRIEDNEIDVPNLSSGKTYYYRVRSIHKIGVKSKFSPAQKTTVNFIQPQPQAQPSKGEGVLIGLGYKLLNNKWKNYFKNEIFTRFEINYYLLNPVIVPSISISGGLLLPPNSRSYAQSVDFAAGAYSQLLPRSVFSPLIGFMVSFSLWDALPENEKNSSFGVIPSFGLQYKISAHTYLRLQTDYFYNFSNQLNSLGIMLGINFK